MRVFCFDNNLSPRIVQVLRILRYQNLTHVRDHHRIDPGDAAIVDLAALHDWVLITADARMQSQPATAAAFREARITALFIGGTILDLGLREQAIWFVRHWGDIAATLPQAPRGTIFASRTNRVLTQL